MDNQWLNKMQVQKTGKPCLIPHQVEINGEWVWDGKWVRGEMPRVDILLPFHRCKRLGCPVQKHESPSAYMYYPRESSQFKYVPYWARRAEQIDLSKALDIELRVLRSRRKDLAI
ncbi:hypothetical protein D3C87_993930 [compost metagenome]